MKSYLTTSQVASAAGVHPNTVRRYEEWGLIPVAPRTPKGYRRFDLFHLDQMQLARTALEGMHPGKNIRRSLIELVKQSASRDLGGALESAYKHLALVQAERAQAEAAARMLERWAQGTPAESAGERLQIGEVAKRLQVTTDMLRNWERNGLVRVPRHPHNRYRQYSNTEIGRLRVIRMLSRAGYSQMAILRMLLQLDRGQAKDLRKALDTPRPDEDVFTAADRWLSSLTEQEIRANQIIAILEDMLVRHGSNNP